MTRDEYTKSMNKLWQSNYTFQEECKKSIDIKTEYILSLEAKIAKLEALKSYATCSFYVTRYNINDIESYKYCTAEVNKASDNFSCSKYKQKDTK